jgi:hypothetical protein
MEQHTIKKFIYYYKQFKMYKLKHWFDIENFYYRYLY